MNKNAKTSRLFFALWPNDQIRHSIVETFPQFSQAMHGRVMQPHNLHMTLHFVGSVTEDIKECMHMAATSIRADSFVCNLNCYGYFPRAKIFWMGCQDTPIELIHLRDKLGATLENCGYHTDKRIFTPHITLMRKCVEAEHLQANCSLQWPIGEFALVESRSDMHGVNYQLIEKYPFSADKPQNNN